MNLFRALPDAALNIARMVQGTSKAKEDLNRAIEIFKECGADGWVEKYAKELASLS
jgi:hypothetical protein